MTKSIFTLAAIFVAASSFATSLTATHTDQVEDTGTYKGDSQYWNFGKQASRTATFLSFGAADFDASSLGTISGISAASLVLTDSVYSSSKTVNVSVWAVTDTTTSLAQGQTTVAYNDGVTGGYTNQLGTPTLLGSYTFTPDTSNPGRVDTINLTSGLSALTSLVNGGNHDIRLVLTTDESGLATYAGAGNGTAGAPVLNVTTQSVPEPISMSLLGLGVVGLIRRKRSA